jgi:hypothetical protein
MVVPEHVGRVQVLMIDRVVLLHERQCRLAMTVLPLSPYLQTRLGEQYHSLAPAIAPTLPPRDTPLGHLQRTLRLAVPTRVEDARLVGVVARHSIPRSIPVSCPLGGNGCTRASAQEKQTYQPAASREIVSVLGVPSNGRDQRTAMRPILEWTRKPLSSVAPLPNPL